MTRLGGLLPHVAVTPPGPRSLKLAERLRGVESANVTYLAPDFPVFWAEAAGANVRDVDGNVYVDLTSAFGVALAGHRHPAIMERVQAQSRRLVHGMGDVHPAEAKVALLERLAELAPWPDARAVLASTGSEAVEIALKTALLATGKPGVIAFEGAYHGLTMGSLAATHRADFRDPFGERIFEGVVFAPYPVRPGREDAALAAVDAALEDGTPSGHAVGAVIVEPIQGRAGVRIPPKGFLAELADRVRSAGAVLVFDEIFTGFGRTGALFAFRHEGVLPDVLCVGKALGGGLPLSACLAPEGVMAAWPTSSGEALHTSTFLGHPLSCAAALAFLDVLDEERLVERSGELGADLKDRLSAGLTDLPGVREVRGRGLLLGVELDGGSGGPAQGLGGRVAVEALRRGVLVLPAGDRGRVVEMTPPATLTREQCAVGAAAVIDAIGAVAGGSA